MHDMKLPKKPRRVGTLLSPLNQPERARAKALAVEAEKILKPAKAARRAEKERLRGMRKRKGK